MTDYTITTNFGAKDSLPSGNAAKVIKGSEFTTEFTNIATAVNSKADTAGDTFTGVVNFSDVVNFSADVAFDTDTLFVDVSTDRVGMGTTTPEGNLHISAGTTGDATLILEADTDNAEPDGEGNNPRIELRQDGHLVEGSMYMEGLAEQTATDSIFNALVLDSKNDSGTNHIQFATGGSTGGSPTNSNVRMSIMNTGTVGINTANPSSTHKLDVRGAVKIDGGTNSILDVISDDNGRSEIRLVGSNQGTGRVLVGQAYNYGGGIEYNGDNSPSSTGAGADYTTLFRRRNSVDSWTAKNFVDNNNWSFRGTVTENASDERLKENITPIENALEKVEQLRGVTFDWKDDVEEKGFIPYAKHETGVIAQDVQKVIPDAAVPAPFDENYLTVKHEKIIPLLIESIKELNTEVQALRSRVAQLEESE